MVSFVVAILCLVTGYFIYGSVAERVFKIDPARRTPCYRLQDGVDFIPMSTKRVFLIQFLNIAGTGPIFGAIQGILFGPAAYLWIVLGCIFGGAVHDFMFGMMSVRRDGKSIPEVVSDELGRHAHIIICVLSLVLMVLVGTVFATTPAGLLASMTASWGTWGTTWFWLALILVYYFFATMFPIDKLIGRIYPIFGIALLLMAAGLLYGIFVNAGEVPEITSAFANHHPSDAIPLFPGLCITIACGAVSGFHGTQSPMMARCLTNEKYGRPVFYGAMITEGIVALIWAVAAIKFADALPYDGATPYEKLLNLMTENGAHSVNPALLVSAVCTSWLGKIGAVLAVLGVVAAPITSGDTAFRSARLILSDFIRLPQNTIARRLILAAPIFAIAAVLVFVDFTIIWRYFAWTNQTLATVTLWTIAVWLTKERRYPWVALVPALFMTVVCSTYICIAPEGLRLPHTLSYCLGGVITLLCLVLYVRWCRRSALSGRGKEPGLTQ
ncbi:MAG: carbon starvation protein A [Prevotella sp.]|nr:carbon starvation protein A [Prevotella sp.]